MLFYVLSSVVLLGADSCLAAWYGSGWLYRQEITVPASVTDADLTDFPYLVRIVDAGNPIFGNAQADGDDLLFTTDDGATQLDHEIEKYDATPANSTRGLRSRCSSRSSYCETATRR